MEEILIGLFLNILARFIKNPHHAEQFRDQLEHIDAGIQAVLQQIDVVKKVESK